ncbi:multiple epidermal growth factor-like domains protein 10 [Saccostrea cucullata]|uniref:multiple epidermal growth factor-like domains protein 10 n=1 Tax=Saccostrea cuccullata TaxID=36930 RepID=UPI002ED100E0
MKFCYYIMSPVFSLCLTITSVKCQTTKSGICSKEGEELKCCTDYVKNGDMCIECIGYFGPQCNKECVPGFYGFGCRRKCNCNTCDRINGTCLQISTVNNMKLKGISLESWLLILFGVVVIIGSLVVVLVINFVRKRSSHTIQGELETKVKKIENYSEDDWEYEMSYDDLRESQMIVDEIVLPTRKHGTNTESNKQSISSLYAIRHKY